MSRLDNSNKRAQSISSSSSESTPSSNSNDGIASIASINSINLAITKWPWFALGIVILVWILVATTSDAARVRDAERAINEKQDVFTSLQGLRVFADKVDSVSKRRNADLPAAGLKSQNDPVRQKRMASLAREAGARLDQLGGTVADEKSVSKLRILIDSRLKLLDQEGQQSLSGRRVSDGASARAGAIDSEILSTIGLIEKQEAASLLDLSKKYASSHGNPILPSALAIALGALLVGIILEMRAWIFPFMGKRSESGETSGKKRPRAELSPERQILNATHRKLPAYNPGVKAADDQADRRTEGGLDIDPAEAVDDQRIAFAAGQFAGATADRASEAAARSVSEHAARSASDAAAGSASEVAAGSASDPTIIKIVSADEVSDIVRRIQSADLPVILSEKLTKESSTDPSTDPSREPSKNPSKNPSTDPSREPSKDPSKERAPDRPQSESYTYSDFQRQVDPLPHAERTMYPQPALPQSPQSVPPKPESPKLASFDPLRPYPAPIHPTPPNLSEHQEKSVPSKSSDAPVKQTEAGMSKPKIWSMPAWHQMRVLRDVNAKSARKPGKKEMSDSGSWDIDTLFGWPPRPEGDNSDQPDWMQGAETAVDVDFEEMEGWDLPENVEYNQQTAGRSGAENTIQSKIDQQTTVRDMKAILGGTDTANGGNSLPMANGRGSGLASSTASDAGSYGASGVGPGPASGVGHATGSGVGPGTGPVAAGTGAASISNGFTGSPGVAAVGNGHQAIQGFGSMGVPYADAQERYKRHEGYDARETRATQKTEEIVRDDRTTRPSDAELQRTTGEYSSLFWTSARDGKLEFMSPKWYQYTGTGPQQNEGLGWLMLLHPADRDRVLPLFEATASPDSVDLEFRVLGKDGIYRPFATRRMPIRDAAGEVIKWCGSLKLVETQFS